MIPHLYIFAHTVHSDFSVVTVVSVTPWIPLLNNSAQATVYSINTWLANN